jgi:hypothetical protein
MTHGNNAPPLSSAWSAQETDACFIVRDANGQALAYVVFRARARDDDQPPSAHPRARRIAANIAKLPELLTAPGT